MVVTGTFENFDDINGGNGIVFKLGEDQSNDDTAVDFTNHGTLTVSNGTAILTGSSPSSITVVNEGSVTITGDGEAIYITRPNVTVTNSGTILMTAQSTGDAIYYSGTYANTVITNAGTIELHGNGNTGVFGNGDYSTDPDAQAVTVQNSGTILLDGADNGEAFFIRGGASTAPTLVRNTGSIQISGDTTYADAIFVQGGAATIENSGTIHAAGANGSGVFVQGGIVTIENTGTIEVLDGSAIYYQAPGSYDEDTHITNSGSIISGGVEADAISLASRVDPSGNTVSGSTLIENSGTITSNSEGIAYGIRDRGSAGSGTVTVINSEEGVIQSDSGGGVFLALNGHLENRGLINVGSAYAVYMSSNGSLINYANATITGGTDASGAVRLNGGAVDNRGTIQFNGIGSGYAVRADTITNSGTITGTGAILSNGSLVNTGNITGEVVFGEAGNTVDTRDGVIVGNTYLAGGNDTYLGSANNDHVEGGAGADTLDGGAGTDTASYLGSVGGVTVNLGTGVNSGADAEGDTLISIENLVGSRYADSLTGDAGNNILAGGAGADILNGGDGNDTADYSTSSGGVIVNLATGAAISADADGDILTSIENLIGSGFDDFLTGDDRANTLTGGDGNDTLDGGAGVDTLIGGAGNDTYYVDNRDDQIVEAAGEGSDQVYSSINIILADNVEHLFLTGNAHWGYGNSSDNLIIGGTGEDHLFGRAGSDILDGGAGADVLAGGTGDDSYLVDNRGDQIIEAAGEGYDTVFSTVNIILTANVEDLFLREGARWGYGNNLNNRLTGTSGADNLFGYAGNDTLRGGAGADRMVGGTGNDTYEVDNRGDQAIEAAGEGTDTVISSINLVLGDNLENLTLSGDARWGYGNALANTVIGTDVGDDHLFGRGGNDRLEGLWGNDILDGGIGADTMVGGAGDDIYYVDNKNDQVVEAAGEGYDTVFASINTILADNVEKLQLTGSATWGYGNGLDNRVTGGAGNDHLYGRAGNDILNGGAGADWLTGGVGDDTYYVDNKNDQVIESAGQGTDTIVSSVNMILGDHVENLQLAGSATWGYGNGLDNRVTGGAGNDHLYGRAGDDILNGGAGADWLTGGIGDDTYYVDNRGDQVIESAGQGSDTVISSINMVLADNVENLVVTGNNAWGYGNSLDNHVSGRDGDDHLFGGAGDDILYGSYGADILNGGSGRDTFVYDNPQDSGFIYGFGGIDTIADFNVAEDHIDLSGVDANALLAGDQAFTFVGEGEFTGTIGELVLSHQDGATWLMADTTGDASPNFMIRLSGTVNISAGNLTL